MKQLTVRLHTYIALLTASLFLTMPLSGQAAQHFSRRLAIGSYQGAIIVVGEAGEETMVQSIIDQAIAAATQAWQALDGQNPASDIARLNANAGNAQKVSANTLALLKAAREVAEWTGGAFDINDASSTGKYKSIAINENGGTASLKKSGMVIRADQLLEGFLADTMIQSVAAYGRSGALVRIGTVFRALGQAVYGPWRVDVETGAGTASHRALSFTLGSAGLATISASDFRAAAPIDPRTQQPAPITCQGVTAAMGDATRAQGLARAIFILGPQAGTALLTKLPNAKAVIVDEAGNYIRSPGF